MRKYQYECLGETLAFAEWLGWEFDEDENDGRIEFVDNLEIAAIEYIEAQGYEVIQ
tara:strand:+ start:59 stop:226 length:168 start_codon:yes stop_codon:yes gene_type:complete